MAGEGESDRVDEEELQEDYLDLITFKYDLHNLEENNDDYYESDASATEEYEAPIDEYYPSMEEYQTLINEYFPAIIDYSQYLQTLSLTNILAENHRNEHDDFDGNEDEDFDGDNHNGFDGDGPNDFDGHDDEHINATSTTICNFIANFTTNKIFDSRDHLLSWVRKVGRALGISVPIGMSNIKVTPGGRLLYVRLGCERSGSYRDRRGEKRSYGKWG
ncbi:hypothetical protein GIB67_020121 [Kingdonia uniflora]|uniref:Uncharacterized protein n=1 Tax=Kingdonia uniflora TaxID=39325 RepID=A0A7J7P7N1_9MAGN|nr:hypothetical protein GIB67_020121 [Kingdonia uniflora]